MRLWLVTYDGAYMGGKAIVFADTEEDAIELVRSDPNTTEFHDVIAEAMAPLDSPRVIYNDDGDY